MAGVRAEPAHDTWQDIRQAQNGQMMAGAGLGAEPSTRRRAFSHSEALRHIEQLKANKQAAAEAAARQREAAVVRFKTRMGSADYGGKSAAYVAARMEAIAVGRKHRSETQLRIDALHVRDVGGRG